MVLEFMEVGVPGSEWVLKGFPRGSLIVVRGAPGTGKTVFAATFLHEGALKYGDPGLYVSFGENKEKFYGFMRGFGMDFEKLEERGLFRYLSLPTLLENGVSGLLMEILNAADSMKAKRLVIDPFTTISRAFKDEMEARAFLHTLLSNIVARLGCVALLIKEELGPGMGYSFEDYVADALICLKARRLEDRLLREMSFVKTRGIETRSPDICVTLYRGFKMLPRQKVPRPLSNPSFNPPQDPPGAYTTGILELDEELGGFPHDSIILWEIDPRLSFHEYSLAVAPALASFLARNRPYIVLPSAGVTWRDVRDLYVKYYGISEDKLSNLLNVLTMGPIEAEPPPYVKLLKGRSWWEVFDEFADVVHSLARERGPHLVRLIGADTLIAAFGEDTFKFFERWVGCFKETGGLAMWIVKPVHPHLVRMLSPMVDMHFRIVRKHGCILLYGKRPETPLYALQPDPEKNALIPKVTPIV
jgi:KaiC/GvpD/RAD55 family RecA-like ATPase